MIQKIEEAALQQETLYTYYQIDFDHCGLDFDYTIVPTLEDVLSNLRMVDHVLDAPDYEPECQPSVRIRGIGLTRKYYTSWCEDNGVQALPQSKATQETVKLPPIGYLFNDKFYK